MSDLDIDAERYYTEFRRINDQYECDIDVINYEYACIMAYGKKERRVCWVCSL
jgi:hypothetical protein